jgi:hypothetical protein
MLKVSGLILLLCVLIFCTNLEIDKPNRLNVQRNECITLIDSVDLDSLRYGNPFSPVGMYRIFYVGPERKIVNLPQKGVAVYEEFDSSGQSCERSNAFTLSVDTTINLSFTSHVDSLQVPEKYAAYALIITNNADAPVYVGTFGVLRAVREIRLDTGWVSVEVPIGFFCGTGARRVILKRDEIAIAKVLRSNGKKKYDCRLRLDFYDRESIYSNVFTDRLDTVIVYAEEQPVFYTVNPASL